MPSPTRLAIAACLLSVLGGVIACNRFTRPRYETIWRGQPQRSVQTKLGRPQQVRRDAWIYVHHRPFYSAAILFERGRVAGKLWSFEKVISDEAIREHRGALRCEPPKPGTPAKAPPSR